MSRRQSNEEFLAALDKRMGSAPDLRAQFAAEKARADAAEADCAVMRRALGDLDQGLQDAGSDPYCQGETTARDIIRDALSSDSGKRLLEAMERREKLLREAMVVVDRYAPDLAGRIEKELEPKP